MKSQNKIESLIDEAIGLGILNIEANDFQNNRQYLESIKELEELGFINNIVHKNETVCDGCSSCDCGCS